MGGDSAFNYLAGDKNKVDPIKERNKRMIEEGMTPEQMGKIGAMESTFDRINYGNSLLNKIDTIQNNRDLISMNPEDAFNQKALQSNLDKKEDETRTNLREFYRGDTNFGVVWIDERNFSYKDIYFNTFDLNGNISNDIFLFKTSTNILPVPHAGSQNVFPSCHDYLPYLLSLYSI